MNKIKSISKSFLALSIITCFGLLTVILMPKVKAATNKVFYITVSVGETYETAGINYHCSEDGSYVMYGVSESSMQKVESNSKLWSVEQDPDDTETGFAARYVCKAQLTNLLPDTTYLYYIVVGNEKSETRTFKTGKTGGSNSVLFLTDTQSASQAQFEKINPLVQAIEAKEKNLNMVFMTGDIVDRGGYSAQWDGFFNGLTALNHYQFATVPGNHEYYHDKNPGYINASYYNQFFNNPQNGPEDRLNSSYYFVYGETLYIMLDILPYTKNPYDLAKHQAWFKQVVADHPTRWIVVGSHAGAISAGAYASDAKDIWSKWHEVFEECQVDLALSGHEHIYIRKDLAYQGEKNENLGVTYLVAPAAGPKDYAAQTTEGLDKVIRGNYRGNVIKTQGSLMTVTLYDTSGTVIESFTLNSKRNGEPAEMSDKEILDSVEYQYDESTSKLHISWSTDLWGVVKEVKCSGDSTWSQVIPSCAPEFASHTINGVYNSYNYSYTLTFVRLDGTEITKNLDIILNKDLLPTAINISGDNSVGVGQTTKLEVTVEPTGSSQSVTFESLTPSIATVDEFGVVTGISKGKARIKVTSTINPSLSKTYTINVVSAPESISIDGLPETYVIGREYSFTVTAIPSDSDKSVTWESSNEDVAMVYNGKIYIIDYGTATLTATSKSNPNAKYTFTITCAQAPESISVSAESTTIGVGKSTQLTVSVSPSESSKAFVFTSSNPSVATVDKNGLVKGVSEGTVVIKVASASNPNVYKEITITVSASGTQNPPKKGCGCGKKSAEFVITLTSALALLAIAVRKKH